MDLDRVVIDQIGAEHDEICTARMPKRWKENSLVSGGDHDIGQFPRCRNFSVDAGNPAPGTIPFGPCGVPQERIESVGKICHLIKHDTVCCKCRRRRDCGTLTILLKGCLWSSGKIESFYSWTVETSAIGCSPGAAGWKVRPSWREKTVKDLAGRAKAREFQPRAPFVRSRI